MYIKELYWALSSTISSGTVSSVKHLLRVELSHSQPTHHLKSNALLFTSFFNGVGATTPGTGHIITPYKGSVAHTNQPSSGQQLKPSAGTVIPNLVGS